MVSSEVHLTGLSQVVTTAGSKPADNIFVVYRKSILTGPSSLSVRRNSPPCPVKVVSETYIPEVCTRQRRFSTDVYKSPPPTLGVGDTNYYSSLARSCYSPFCPPRPSGRDRIHHLCRFEGITHCLNGVISLLLSNLQRSIHPKNLMRCSWVNLCLYLHPKRLQLLAIRDTFIPQNIEFADANVCRWDFCKQSI